MSNDEILALVAAVDFAAFKRGYSLASGHQAAYEYDNNNSVAARRALYDAIRPLIDDDVFDMEHID